MSIDHLLIQGGISLVLVWVIFNWNMEILDTTDSGSYFLIYNFCYSIPPLTSLFQVGKASLLLPGMGNSGSSLGICQRPRWEGLLATARWGPAHHPSILCGWLLEKPHFSTPYGLQWPPPTSGSPLSLLWQHPSRGLRMHPMPSGKEPLRPNLTFAGGGAAAIPSMPLAGVLRLGQTGHFSQALLFFVGWGRSCICWHFQVSRKKTQELSASLSLCPEVPAYVPPLHLSQVSCAQEMKNMSHLIVCFI